MQRRVQRHGLMWPLGAGKLLTQDIILTQQAQIGQMQGWLMSWARPLAGQEAPMAGRDQSRMVLASEQEERELQRLPVNMAGTRSLVLMRRHQGGVAMAKSALKTVKRPEVQAYAERVVSAQTAEIAAIDALLGERRTGELGPQPEVEGMTHE